MTRIKINGKWVNVKEGDELDTKVEGAEGADDGEGEEGVDADTLEQAKKIGKKMAEDITKELEVKFGGNPALEKKMAAFFENQTSDSKLTKILNGKDLYGSGKAELTKEEKIIGFFHALVSKNHMALKALAEGTGADGGYLFPNEFFTEIVRDIAELNVMRQYVRVIPMKRDAMDITSLVDGLDVFWTAENAAKSTTTARFATATLTAKKMAAILYASDELVEDSTEIDVVNMIVGLFSEAVAEEEERVIWLGNGTTEPQGITAATIGGTVNGTGNNYDDLVSLKYALPRKYRVNAAFFANDRTAGILEGLKDSTGRPIFNQSLAEGRPDTLLGRPLVVGDWIPDRMVYFADLKRGYFLGDRKRMTVKVSNDTETAFTKDQTAIRVVARIGGLVVLPQAIRRVTNF